MSGSPSAGLVVSLILGMSMVATPAQSQVPDHLKCFKVKDPLKLAGTVDLDTPQFGVDPGCRISKAKLFCVPATTTNVAVIDRATELPITPLPVTGPDPGDRICYTVKCPATVADQQVTDQFGTRTLSMFNVAMVCTPAVKGPPTTTTTTPLTTTTTPTTTTTTLPGACRSCWISVSDSCSATLCTTNADCQAEPNMFCMSDLCSAACPSTTTP